MQAEVESRLNSRAGDHQSKDGAALEKLFEEHILSFDGYTCSNCRERKLRPSSFLQGNFRNKCKKHSSKFTAANNMDPFEVSAELPNLSLTEVQLI